MKNENIIKLGIFICVVLGMVALYFFTPLSDYLEIDKITELASDIPDNTLTAFIFLVVFLFGGRFLSLFL